ncbi:MAG: MarR family transcriptional regulator, partial [Methanomicrobia archaeon]|nr:MarR family transcriptional regulator [Methanomicrobia archaeon]
MNEHKKILNEFLVDTFNDILRQEEIALAHLSNHTLS